MWLVFALIANVFYSFTAIFDQLLRRNHIKHNVSLTVLWVASFFVIWLLAIPFIHVSVPAWPQLLAGIAAGMIVVLVALPYFYALATEEASRVMPMWQFSSVVVLAISVTLLGEKLLPKHYYGFVAMLLGGMLLAVDKSVRGFKINKTLLLVLAAAAIWGVSLVLTKFLYATESFWNGFVWFGVGHFIGAVALLLVPKNRRIVHSEFRKLTRGGIALLAASTVVTFAADVIGLFAITSGPVSLVSVIGVTQIMFLFLMTVFLSKYFPRVLKERIDRKALLTKLAAIALMIVGLYLVR